MGNACAALRVLPPLLFGAVVYHMIGLNPLPERFAVFLISLVLVNVSAAASCFAVVLLLVVFGGAGNPFMLHGQDADGAATTQAGWAAWCEDHRSDAAALGAPCPRAVPGAH